MGHKGAAPILFFSDLDPFDSGFFTPTPFTFPNFENINIYMEKFVVQLMNYYYFECILLIVI